MKTAGQSPAFPYSSAQPGDGIPLPQSPLGWAPLKLSKRPGLRCEPALPCLSPRTPRGSSLSLALTLPVLLAPGR